MPSLVWARVPGRLLDAQLEVNRLRHAADEVFDDDDFDSDDFSNDDTGNNSLLVDTIMRQLLAKDVLYEPMKEIGERYHVYLAEARTGGVVSSEEIRRYEAQAMYIAKICGCKSRSVGGTVRGADGFVAGDAGVWAAARGDFT